MIGGILKRFGFINTKGEAMEKAMELVTDYSREKIFFAHGKITAGGLGCILGARPRGP